MKIFFIGQVVVTRGVNDTIAENSQFTKEVVAALDKYRACDWGDICKEDSKLNNEAVRNGNERIVAKYPTSEGDIFIITEWDRSITTILFTHEY